MNSVAQHQKSRVSAAIAVVRDEIRLGKDVLELVSTAMYVDPMTVYREYIQNAADAIDAARASGILTADEPGTIDIAIDPVSRAIRIRDNAAGLAPDDFVARLTALGASSKRGTGARGFRGVGRLVGLGHAQELIFRSRSLGHDEVLELRWDCRRLKTVMSDTVFDGDVGDLIAQIVSLARLPGDEYPTHFFEVELCKVVRQRSDKLMDPSAVSDYLAQIAPVPFSRDFRFAVDILSELKAVADLGEIEIRVNGSAPLVRPHRNEIELAFGKTNAFDELSIVEIPSMEGDVAAIGWFLHHNYDGALPAATLVKGVRLRVGNLQVGDHTILEEVFPEVRFNAWSVGEIHVLDPRVIPNGRRDQFEQNAHFNNLVNHLGPSARDIARRCRTNSAKRSKLREFELVVEEVNSRLEVLRQGGLGRAQRRNHALAVEAALSRMEKIAELDQLVGEAAPQMRGVAAEMRAALAKALDELETGSGPLDRLPPANRAMYEQMFELIYDCAANRKAAKALVERIIQKVAAATS
jgi:molecular chaperone HtpG